MVVSGTSVPLQSESTSTSPAGTTVSFVVSGSSDSVSTQLFQDLETATKLDVFILAYDSSTDQGTDTMLAPALVASYITSTANQQVIATVTFTAESTSVICTGAVDTCNPGDRALQLTSSANPATAGSAVTFTATESVIAGGPGPTGTVSFTADNTALPGCTNVPLNAAQAACTTSSLAGGSQVVSVQYSGDGDYAASTATLTITVTSTSPGAPTGLTATAGAAQVSLSWTAPASDGGSQVTGYNVYEGTSPGGESSAPVNSSPVTATNYLVTGLASGTYYFVVTAVNQAGEGPESAEASATVTEATQAIAFTSTQPSPAVYGGSYSPAATGGGSGNAVTFSVDSSSAPGACSISSGTVSFTGTGLCVIDANQAGGSGYAAAGQVQQSVTINPAPLTAIVTGGQTYGSASQQFTAAYSGLVNGDTSSVVSGTLTGCASSVPSSAAAGTYTATISGCGGLSAANYAISYADGGFTVNTAPLLISASSASMVYGAAVPSITPGYAGFVNGDSASSLTTSPACSTTATSSSAVGTYPSACSGAVDANYAISYQAGTVTVGQASTTTADTGPQQISSNSSFAPAAALSSSAAACQTGQSVTFTLNANPVTGAAGTYSLESATTGASGLATGTSISTANWQTGSYTITASFAGTADCAGSSATTAVLLTVPGTAAAGLGRDSVTGAGAVSFGFAVVPGGKAGGYKGLLALVNQERWEFTASIASYLKTGGPEGIIAGTGTLSWWDQAANHGAGKWVQAATGVSYTATFTPTTSSSHGSFGITIGYTPASPQPSPLPNSGLTSLSGGAIALS